MSTTTMRTAQAATILPALLLMSCNGADNGQSASSPMPGDSDSISTEGWLVDVTADSGLDFVHESGGQGEFHLPEIMGAGGALFDYDNDGDLDIYVINGHKVFTIPPSGGEIVNRLYRQDEPWKFSDVTDESGLGDNGYGMGVAIGDIDNDGDVDVFVTNYGPSQLYTNNDDGTFTNATESASIDVDGWSTSAAFLDYNRDGFLDLFIARYLEFDPTNKCTDNAGRPDYCSPGAFSPTVDVLLHNNGDGTFRDVTGPTELTTAFGHGLGVVCEDLNDDGWVDIYVANDGDANQLWINQQDETFRNEAIPLGVAFNMHGRAEAGMGVLAADLNGDARLDLFMTHLRNESNTLYSRLGEAVDFTDMSSRSGLATPSIRQTGFGTAAMDLELDGDLDLFIGNGSVARGDVPQRTDLAPPWSRYVELNEMFVNNGQGEFTRQPNEGGDFCRAADITRGLAVGDIDGDGDVDMLVTNTQGPARVYRNDAPRRGKWLAVRAIDPRFNRDAIGATIIVTCSDRTMVRTINTGFSYLAAHEAMAHFGLGSCTAIDQIQVMWPDGLAEVFSSTCIDCEVVLKRGDGQSASASLDEVVERRRRLHSIIPQMATTEYNPNSKLSHAGRVNNPIKTIRDSAEMEPVHQHTTAALPSLTDQGNPGTPHSSP